MVDLLMGGSLVSLKRCGVPGALGLLPQPTSACSLHTAHPWTCASGFHSPAEATTAWTCL